MDNIGAMLIKPVGNHTCSVDEALGAGASLIAAMLAILFGRQPGLCSIFIHDPNHAGMLFV